MLPYPDALAAIDALLISGRIERIPVYQALRRPIATDVRLDADQPPFDRATMDGYAVRLDGENDHFAVVGVAHAGAPFVGQLSPGQGIRIMTGAPCPPDVTVIPLEATDRGSAIVAVIDPKALKPGRNIAWRGEDGSTGDLVLSAGTRLNPVTVAVAAMAGVTSIDVAGPPNLAFITTGDEVGASGSAAIKDSNGPFLTAFAAALGLASSRSHARDEASALRYELKQAGEEADIIVTAGGVSAGERDLVPTVAAELGFQIIFHHVAMQPGRPVLLAYRSRPRSGNAVQFLVGLPGNPVSVVATAHLVLLPIIARYPGQSAVGWKRMPLASARANPSSRHLFLPAQVIHDTVEPIAWNGSGDLIAAAAGDGLVAFEPRCSMRAGDLIGFLPYVGANPGEHGHRPERRQASGRPAPG